MGIKHIDPGQRRLHAKLSTILEYIARQGKGTRSLKKRRILTNSLGEWIGLLN
jgi:hypothetical protein